MSDDQLSKVQTQYDDLDLWVRELMTHSGIHHSLPAPPLAPQAPELPESEGTPS